MKTQNNKILPLALTLAALVLILSGMQQAKGAGFVSVSPMKNGRNDHTATLLPNGKVLVAGGYNNPAAPCCPGNSAELYDLATDTWNESTTTGTPPSARSAAVAVYDAARDRLSVFGGNTSTDGAIYAAVNDVLALDLATGEWTSINAGTAPDPRLAHGGIVLNGELVIFGGHYNFGGPYFNDSWALDLATDQWRPIHPGGAGAPDARFGGELFADPTRHR